MTNINRPCPVCEKPLWLDGIDWNSGKVAVFCGYGPCPSHVTNQGGEGATEQEAYDVLCRKVEEELMQNEPN